MHRVDFADYRPAASASTGGRLWAVASMAEELPGFNSRVLRLHDVLFASSGLDRRGRECVSLIVVGVGRGRS